MTSYHERRGSGPDFRVRYRFLSAAEGGRAAPPFQHIRCDFLYEGDDPQKEGAWCIWPEFLSPGGTALLHEDQCVPMEGLADMYVLNSELRQEHARRIRLGTKGYFLEGARKTAVCEVVAVLGLSDAL